MKKYFGGLVALAASLNMISAFADCGCGSTTKGNKLMATCNAGACAASAKATPAPAAQPTVADAAQKPKQILAPNEAKDKVAAVELDQISEEDSEDEE